MRGDGRNKRVTVKDARNQNEKLRPTQVHGKHEQRDVHAEREKDTNRGTDVGRQTKCLFSLQDL